MTHYEKLDAILNGLLYIHQQKLDRKIDQKATFKFICQTVTEDTQEWEIKYLGDTLENDGYIKFDEFGDPIIADITPSGIKFIQAGGYRQINEEKSDNYKIRKETIKKFEFDKIAFGISIISLIIALIALLN